MHQKRVFPYRRSIIVFFEGVRGSAATTGYTLSASGVRKGRATPKDGGDKDFATTPILLKIAYCRRTLCRLHHVRYSPLLPPHTPAVCLSTPHVAGHADSLSHSASTLLLCTLTECKGHPNPPYVLLYGLQVPPACLGHHNRIAPYGHCADEGSAIMEFGLHFSPSRKELPWHSSLPVLSISVHRAQ